MVSPVLVTTQFTSQPQTISPFLRKDFHVYSGEFLSSQDLVYWISTSGTLARVSGALRKETQETSPGSTTTVFNQVLLGLFMKRHNHPVLHPSSHDNAHCRLSFSFNQPYPGTLRFEVFIRRLRIRIVSQGGTHVLSVGFRCCLFFRLYYSTNPRGSTFYVCVYISVGYVYLYVLFA